MRIAALASISFGLVALALVACSSSSEPDLPNTADGGALSADAGGANPSLDAGYDPDADPDAAAGWPEEQCCRAVLVGDRRGDPCCKRWLDEALPDSGN